MPDSNSNRFIRRLRDAVDDREPIDTPEFRAEAAASEVNRRAWQRCALLASAIEEARSRQPAVDLGQAVLQSLRTSSPGPTSNVSSGASEAGMARGPATAARRSARVVLALSATAALLLFALLSRPANVDPGSQSVASSPTGPTTDAAARPQPPDVPAPEPEIDELLADATAAYRGLARETRGAFADLALFVPSFESNLDEGPMPPMETDNGWVPPSLRNGFDRTLDLLIENSSDEPTST